VKRLSALIPGRTTRGFRLGAAVALAALATAGVGTVSASAASGSAGAISPKVAGCTSSQLTSWLGIPGNGTAGSTYYELQISNIGTTTCSLYGYPGVSAVAAGGAQLGSPAAWDHGFTPSTVVLAPNATSHVVLRITDVANFGSACTGANAVGLRVYPPNQTVSDSIPLSFRACSNTGVIYLTVRPVEAGAGIPGYSN
jgi:Protein of unknown function (DUF4232)